MRVGILQAAVLAAAAENAKILRKFYIEGNISVSISGLLDWPYIRFTTLKSAGDNVFLVINAEEID